jgi:replication-associated recombination protein RarA
MTQKIKQMQDALDSPATPEEFKKDLKNQISILSGASGRGRSRKYEFDKMQVNDEFEIVPATKEQVQRVRACISQYKRMHDRKDTKFLIQIREEKVFCVRLK